ncbi:ABC transporter substrate-binding protein [Paeniglutamicibacter sp. ORCA_105]|uniref:ABC transporter substrate-binding protein n=1 Tax=Paeniglutamicibacter sp. ORCA_105 TaxID=3377336 RepID=UPI0038950495
MKHQPRRWPASRRIAVLLAAGALALTGCGSNGVSAAAESSDGLATVRVGLAIPTFNTALINYVLQEDIDSEHGLNMVPTMGGAGSTNLVAALRSGSFDVVGIGTATAVDANAEGAGLVVVGGTGGLINNIVLNSKVAEGLGVGPDDPIEDRIRALKGLTIASSPPGSSSNSTLRYLVEKYGLNPDRDLSIVPVSDPSAIVAGIRQGKFDGSFFGVGIADVNIADGSGELWVSLPRGDVEAFDDLVGVVLVTTKKYLRENPKAVEAVHASLADAQRRVEADPIKVGEALHEKTFEKLDKDVFDAAWEQAKDGFPDGAAFTSENWQTYQDLFQPSSEKDFSVIKYEDLVAPPARGVS